jgi:hypothetical protein
VAHPAERGTPQLVAARLERAAVSPEGTPRGHAPGRRPLFRRGVSPIAGGKPAYESPGYPPGSGLGPFQWTKDGTALLYSTGRTDEHPGPRLAGRPAQRFTDFSDLTVFRFALSPDGRSILMARGPQSRDAFLLPNS